MFNESNLDFQWKVVQKDYCRIALVLQNTLVPEHRDRFAAKRWNHPEYSSTKIRRQYSFVWEKNRASIVYLKIA